MNTENPLPDGKLLADQLDVAFRNGGFDNQGQTREDAIFRNAVKDWAMFFLTEQFPHSPQAFLPIREEAGKIAESLRIWKEEKLKSKLPWKRGQKDKISAITLQTLAEVANEEYEVSSQLLGSSTSGTSGYDFYRDRTDYWSKIQEITEAALDLG